MVAITWGDLVTLWLLECGLVKFDKDGNEIKMPEKPVKSKIESPKKPAM